MNAASDGCAHVPGDGSAEQMLAVSRNGKGSDQYRGGRYGLWQRLLRFPLVGVAQYVLPPSAVARTIATVAMAKKLAVHLYWKWHQGCNYGKLQKCGYQLQEDHRCWPSFPKVVIDTILCPSTLVSP